MAPSADSRVVARALGVAALGHAHWFFGNLYEAVVRMPERMTGHGGSPIGPGSPVRYYVAALPATSPALAVAAVAGRRDRDARPWLFAACACSAVGTGITAHLVATVNRKLFFGTTVPAEAEREALLHKWYRLNTVRLAATAGTWLAIRRAKSRLPR